MPRKLIDIEAEEISLVDKAANRRKFAFKKEHDNMDELVELLKGIVGEKELKDEDIAKAKELPEDAAKAIKGALNILNKFKDDFPPDILGAVKTLTRYASYGYPEKPKAEELSKEDIEKVGARLSKATLEELQKMKGLLDGVDLKAFRKVTEILNGLIDSSHVEKKYADLPEDVRKRLARLDAIEEAERLELQKADKSRMENIETSLKDVKDTLEKLTKVKGIRKSLDGQETDDKDKTDTADKWPSLSSR